MISLRHRLAMGVTTFAFGFGALTAHIPEARADEVSPTGKGIVGCALLGPEVVMIIGGIAGVKSPWYYVIGGGLAAIGGGIGGYFIEQAVNGDGHIPVYLLGGGLLGVIPALVLTLNATRYQPPAGAKEDKAPTNLHDADPGKVGGSVVGGSTDTGTTPAPAPTPAPSGGGGSSGGTSTPPPPPQSLLDVHQGTFRMGVPIPQVRTLYTMAERKEMGLGEGYELRMPVVRVSF
jgi:hypothetical protein